MSLTVLHVITTLGRGGAEHLLAATVEQLTADGVRGEVVCLADWGELADRIEAAGWPVHTLDMAPGRVGPGDLRRLRHLIARADTDVVHTWMYHADLLGGIAARTTGRPVVWSLHHSAMPRGSVRTSTRTIARINGAMSWWLPGAIICTSAATRDFHAGLGYRRGRLELIPTGFDPATPDLAAHARVRRQLGLPTDSPMVVRVARSDPQKDHGTLLAAFRRILAARPDVHLVLVGRGVEESSSELAVPADLRDDPRLHLLGERGDAATITAAADVAVSSSAFGESTPLVIGEAMASGVPVVTTDVGDCAQLVGDTGRVVPPRDPDRLAAAVLEMLSLSSSDRQQLGAAARQRIEDEYSLARMTGRYTRLYRQLRAGTSASGPPLSSRSDGHGR